MNATELRASLGLAGIYALRMLGMFLILPVFALYAQTLEGADNHTLIGIALGSYGLTQALLQLPLGMLSDKIGRKKVIYGGLLLFALGSFVAAGAHDIATLTVGRVIQGAGAISAAITALLADLTREENRTKAMAMIGMSIGTTFAASLVLGPLLAKYIGVNGIFALTGVLSLAALIGVWLIIPDPVSSRFHSDTEANAKRLPAVLKDPQLLQLNYGIFALHAAQMAMFVTIPFALIKTAHLDKTQHWQVYLPVTVIGFLLMVPAIIYGEKKARLKQVFVGAIALMAAAQLGMAMALDSFWQIVAWLGLYFIAFNILEATLPSLISKIAPADAKGTAIGVYNTAQSLGLFLGAAVGGWLYTRFGPAGVFGFTSLLMLTWLLWSLAMRPPKPVRSVMYHIGEDWRGDAGDLSRQLAGVTGVHEAVVVLEDRVAYLKVSQRQWDEATVQRLIGATF
ncbi:MFS transporter [Chromobacterium rhizoryzae]|uniref:MFS transporter n=1 Tax=Chromobacterium rhizoryzae TaxID=1778675 RepID=UPI001D099B18|nr:MFS transporter [Chromobacterium rhizoryzae]